MWVTLMRLDKFLSDCNVGTRSEIKKIINNGCIMVGDTIAKKANIQITLDADIITYNGRIIQYEKYVYYLLNKPSGYVSATKDNLNDTVIDLLKSENRDDLFPVGRLDIDTEGLLLITNDGKFAHDMLSPKKHVSKKYYAIIDGNVTDKDITKFNKGIKLSDFTTKPAELEIISHINDYESEVFVTIKEGKFHQIKRMFHAIDMEVKYLKRVSMGDIILPDTLNVGEYIKIYL